MHACICLTIPMMFHNIIRGIQFRREFSRIGEIRALTPALTNVMALTATATSVMRKNNRVPIDDQV